MSESVSVDTTLDLHAIVEKSVANGPGERTVIWFQGCPLACPGCFNPETHAAAPRIIVRVGELIESIVDRRTEIDGISVTGGEPFGQTRALADLLAGVRRRSSLSVLVFTGYTWKELARIAGANDCLSYIDVLIAGRYVAKQRIGRGLLGSANQRIHFLTQRYREEDLQRVPPGEILIDRQGRVTMSGVDVPQGSCEPV